MGWNIPGALDSIMGWQGRAAARNSASWVSNSAIRTSVGFAGPGCVPGAGYCKVGGCGVVGAGWGLG